MLQKMRRTNEKGFTLIELMIVIAIIGILSAIAIPNFLTYRTRGQDTAAKNEGANLYSSSLADFADDGVAATFTSAALPTGFSRNTDITYGGNIIIDTMGVTSGTMTFSHSNSTTTYTLTGSTGIISTS